MTAKRFVINNNMNFNNKVETYEFSCIVDNDNKTFYFIVDSIANVESFVERLNELHEENKRLKSDKNRLMGYLIKIRSFDDDDIDAIFNRDAYEEWGEVYYSMKEESELEKQELEDLE